MCSHELRFQPLRLPFICMVIGTQPAAPLRKLNPVSDPKKPSAPGRVWRMSAEVPEGGFMDSVPSGSATSSTDGQVIPAAKVLHPAQVRSWRASSHDLLTGATVSEVTDTIPGDLFDELFKPHR